jgi:hypothetical protein
VRTTFSPSRRPAPPARPGLQAGRWRSILAGHMGRASRGLTSARMRFREGDVMMGGRQHSKQLGSLRERERSSRCARCDWAGDSSFSRCGLRNDRARSRPSPSTSPTHSATPRLPSLLVISAVSGSVSSTTYVAEMRYRKAGTLTVGTQWCRRPWPLVHLRRSESCGVALERLLSLAATGFESTTAPEWGAVFRPLRRVDCPLSKHQTRSME